MSTVRPIAAGAALLALLAAPAGATDGVIEINAARAAAGGVTPGDAPGYPVTISASGSYRLTSNLRTSDKDTDVIVIQPDHVTLDLNGFMIHCCTGRPCTACASGNGNGIVAGGAGVTIRNGTVADMGASGVAINSGAVEGVRARGNKGFGIAAEEASVTGCIVRDNGSYGIHAYGTAATVSGNTVVGNGAGIVAPPGALVSYNVVSANGADGIVGSGLMVVGNALRSNGAVGLKLGSTSGFVHNTTSSNTTSDLTGGVNTGGNVCGAALCAGTP